MSPTELFANIVDNYLDSKKVSPPTSPTRSQRESELKRTLKFSKNDIWHPYLLQEANKIFEQYSKNGYEKITMLKSELQYILDTKLKDFEERHLELFGIND